MKYDGLESDRNNLKTRDLRQLLGLASTDLVFVAGSTMEGEEAAVLAAYNTAPDSIGACDWFWFPGTPSGSTMWLAG